MKISQQERLQVRQEILAAFVELAQKRGVGKVTLAQTAKKAGIANSTIYNYFKSKEKLLVGLLGEELVQVQEQLKEVEALEQYGLQEALQLYLDLLLERFEENRLLIQGLFDQLSATPFSALGDLHQLRKIFLEPVDWIFEAAIERGEIERPPLASMIRELVADLAQGLIFYWLRDDSEDSEKTTRLTDLSLSLLVSFLQSGLMGKALDLAFFLFRQHSSAFARHFEGVITAMSEQGPTPRPFNQPKAPRTPKETQRPQAKKTTKAKAASKPKAGGNPHE